MGLNVPRFRPDPDAAPTDSLSWPARIVKRPGKAMLFFAFAFAVMADPVSSVAYAIEAALRALDGHLELLLPTMALVIGIIALVTLNYWQLVRRFPAGRRLARRRRAGRSERSGRSCRSARWSSTSRSRSPSRSRRPAAP